MKKIFISLCIGVGAGIIDVVPMFLQGLDWYANSSAFVHWVVLGIIISYVSFNMKGWLKGLIVGLISSFPIIIIVLKDDPKSIIPIIIMSIILGSLVGLLTEKYAK